MNEFFKCNECGTVLLEHEEICPVCRQLRFDNIKSITKTHNYSDNAILSVSNHIFNQKHSFKLAYEKAKNDGMDEAYIKMLKDVNLIYKELETALAKIKENNK